MIDRGENLCLPDEPSVQRYAKAWWTDLWEERYIELRPIAHERASATQKEAFAARRFFQWAEPEKLVPRIIEHLSQYLRHAQDWSWYVGAAPRTGRSGKAEDVAALSGAWVDVDDHAGHQAGDATAQRAEVLAALENMGFVPTLVVRSGGGNGRHYYFRYRELCEANEGVAIQRLLASVLQGDLQASDQARVLRLPGTWHTKQTPILCTVETSNPNRECSAGELREALELLAERYGHVPASPNRTARTAMSQGGGEWKPLAKEQAARIVDVCARFRRFADPNQQERLSEPEWGQLGSNLKAVLPNNPSLWLEWSQLDGARAGGRYDERTALEYYDRHYTAPVHCHVLEQTTPRPECRACPFFPENSAPAFLLRRMLGGGRALGAPTHVEWLRQRMPGEADLESLSEQTKERILAAAKYERADLNEYLATVVEAGESEVAAAIGRVLAQADAEPGIEEDAAQIQRAEEALRNGVPFDAALREAIPALCRLQSASELDFERTCRELVEASKASGERISLKLLKTAVRQASVQFGAQALPFVATGAESSRPVVLVGEHLPDAPMRHLVVPTGYALTEEGLFRERLVMGATLTDTVALAPIYISKVYRDVTTGQEAWEVSYRRQGAWQSHLIDRDVGQNARKIVDLSAHGLPVHSDNASDLVKFFAAFEAANLALLPVERGTTHMGWHPGAGYVCGKEYFALDCEPRIQFRAVGGGDEQLCQAIRAEGSLTSWVEAVAPAMQFPVVQMAFYAAFVPPLLDILNCPNFILDFSGKTSRGKTSLLRIAASVFGVPDRDQAASVLGTWNNTPVGLERLCAASTHLPVLLDDTKDAPTPATVAKLIYLIAGGKGKTRGQLKGAAATAAWRTVLLSSGEQPAVSYTRDGGTRGRTVTITRLPFGTPSKATETLLERLSTELSEHYGHGLPLFVRWIIAHREEWGAWRTLVDATRRSYAEQTREETGKRLARYMAAIHVTAELVHRAFAESGYALPWEVCYPTRTLWPDIVGESRDPRGELEALTAVVSWAAANQTRFWGRHKRIGDEAVAPNQGWLGRWDAESWTYLAIEATAITNFLEQSGYSAREVLDGWHEQGWTVATGGKTARQKKQVRVEGENVWCVAIKRETVERLSRGTLEPEEMDERAEELASGAEDDPFA